MENATLKIATAVALILAGSGVALAKGPGGGFDGARPTFEELDVDKSGEITAEDFVALRENRFTTMDADGSGDVSKEEFMAAAAARAGEKAGARFDRLDADGDGVLSRDVLESQRGGRGMGERMLSRLDADNSGGVSQAEFDTAMERFEDRRGKRKGKGGHGWGHRDN